MYILIHVFVSPHQNRSSMRIGLLGSLLYPKQLKKQLINPCEYLLNTSLTAQTKGGLVHLLYLTGSIWALSLSHQGPPQAPSEMFSHLVFPRPPSMCSIFGAPSPETYLLSCPQLHPCRLPKRLYLQSRGTC